MGRRGEAPSDSGGRIRSLGLWPEMEREGAGQPGPRAEEKRADRTSPSKGTPAICPPPHGGHRHSVLLISILTQDRWGPEGRRAEKFLLGVHGAGGRRGVSGFPASYSCRPPQPPVAPCVRRQGDEKEIAVKIHFGCSRIKLKTRFHYKKEKQTLLSFPLSSHNK